MIVTGAIGLLLSKS